MPIMKNLVSTGLDQVSYSHLTINQKINVKSNWNIGYSGKGLIYSEGNMIAWTEYIDSPVFSK